MTIDQTKRSIISRIAPLYPRREAAWMARIILEHLTGKSEVDLLIGADKEVSDFIAGKVDGIVERLLNHEPLQYILGETYFYGHIFKVTPATLIPRPETAELIDMIVDDADSATDLRVIDLGTGSGCIAVSLAMALKFASVMAVDISADAVAVATENASRLHAKVTCEVADMLALVPVPGSYDIIVSNPPYIAAHERASMDANVLDYEPSTALFVPDDDPLKFYRAITRYASVALAAGGRLYFEINPLYADEMVSMVRAEISGADVEVTLDAQGRKRFLRAQMR